MEGSQRLWNRLLDVRIAEVATREIERVGVFVVWVVGRRIGKAALDELCLHAVPICLRHAGNVEIDALKDAIFYEEVEQSLRADISDSIVAPDIERSRVPVRPQCASKLLDMLVVEPVLLVASGARELYLDTCWVVAADALEVVRELDAKRTRSR